MRCSAIDCKGVEGAERTKGAKNLVIRGKRRPRFGQAGKRGRNTKNHLGQGGETFRRAVRSYQ